MRLIVNTPRSIYQYSSMAPRLASQNRPRSIYQYSNMAPRLSGQNSIFGVVFFVSKSLLGIEGQKKLEKFAIFTRKPRSRARILIYRTWPIANCLLSLNSQKRLGYKVNNTIYGSLT